MKDDLLQLLKKKAKEKLGENTRFHCYAHAIEVLENAQKLLEVEGKDKYDDVVMLTAALFHDVSNYQDEREGEDGAKFTEEILREMDTFPKDKIADVKRLIESISREPEKDDEVLISTADEMAAFSDLGLIRSFMISGSRGMKVKDAIEWELSYLEKRFNKFKLQSAKDMVKKSYEDRKKFLENALESYSI
jgi:HD superfamily phosphodiesterase